MVYLKIFIALVTGITFAFVQNQDIPELSDQQRQLVEEVLADTAMTRYIMAEIASREPMHIQMMETMMEITGSAEVANMCQMMIMQDDEVRSMIMGQMEGVTPVPHPQD